MVSTKTNTCKLVAQVAGETWLVRVIEAGVAVSVRDGSDTLFLGRWDEHGIACSCLAPAPCVHARVALALGLIAPDTAVPEPAPAPAIAAKPASDRLPSSRLFGAGLVPAAEQPDDFSPSYWDRIRSERQARELAPIRPVEPIRQFVAKLEAPPKLYGRRGR